MATQAFTASAAILSSPTTAFRAACKPSSIANSTTGADSVGRASLLLSLPPELRNAIYKLVLIRPEPVQGKEPLATAALLHTCRQIRSEAEQIFFACNEFQITLTERSLGTLYALLDAIGSKNTGLMRMTVILDVGNEIREFRETYRMLDAYQTSWKSTRQALSARGVRCGIQYKARRLPRDIERHRRPCQRAVKKYVEAWKGLMNPVSCRKGCKCYTKDEVVPTECTSARD